MGHAFGPTVIVFDPRTGVASAGADPRAEVGMLLPGSTTKVSLDIRSSTSQPKEPKCNPPYRKLGYLASVTFVLLTASHTTYAQIPNPILYMTHTQSATVGGQDVVRYQYDVLNKESYPANLFAAAPAVYLRAVQSGTRREPGLF